jgi:hypothetical protein
MPRREGSRVSGTGPEERGRLSDPHQIAVRAMYNIPQRTSSAPNTIKSILASQFIAVSRAWRGAGPAFQVDAFRAWPPPPEGRIWRPTAVRTFFECPEEPPTNLRVSPSIGFNAQGALKILDGAKSASGAHAPAPIDRYTMKPAAGHRTSGLPRVAAGLRSCACPVTAD